MFIPLYDRNPIRHIRFQFVTFSLIAINILVFTLFQSGAVYQNIENFTYALGAIPVTILGQKVLPEAMAYIPAKMTLFTYMFLHGDWMHLIGNMLFLWVFGDNVEDAMGHVRFLLFYIACGLISGLAHVVLAPASESPLVGASGAIAGVLAAYLMLHPRVRLWVLVLARIPLPLPAWMVLIAWISLQIINYMIPANTAGPGSPATETKIAFVAHIAGFFAGMALVLFMRRRGVPLFDKDLAGVEIEGRDAR